MYTQGQSDTSKESNNSRSTNQKQKSQDILKGNQTRSEINEDDDRDHKDSTTDWDAEKSRTGRHK